MTRDEALIEIKSNWRSIIPKITSPAKSSQNHETSWICPICGHGTHGDGLTFIPRSKGGDGNTLKCFNVEHDFTGSIIDLWMEYYGLEFKDAVDQLIDELHISIDDELPYKPSERSQSEKQRINDKMIDEPEKTAQNGAGAASDVVKQPVPGKYKDYIEKCHARAQETSYFQQRGINAETIDKFMLGYDPDIKTFDHNLNKWIQGAIVMPYSKDFSYFSCRSITDKGFYKPNKEEAGEEPLYNAAALYVDQPCFICESPLDAISIMQEGGNAVALIGTGSDKLLKLIDKKKPIKPLILCLDKDEVNDKGHQPGQAAQKKLAAALDEKNIPYTEATFTYDQYGDGAKKDANDLLRGNASQFAKDIKHNIKAALKKEPFIPYTVSDYLKSGYYEADIDYFKQYRDRKTGFKNIDKHLTLYPGLAALGGSASLGKTTFAVNLADNLLDSGETIIYFALEQEPIEIVTKILARRLLDVDPASPINNIKIKNGSTSAALEVVKREYTEIADRFIIVRCNFTITAAAIRDYVETFIRQTGVKPIVFIDYLQLISPPADLKTDNIRTATDYNVKLFKTMQIDNELLVIMISNFNRGSYSTPVSYEAFKETGMIEYTCDYVWGLQLAVLEDENFYKRQGTKASETNVKEKNDKTYKATRSTVKEVEFVSLKSRNGTQSYKAFFKYNMPFDSFVADFNSQYDKEKYDSNYDFNGVPAK